MLNKPVSPTTDLWEMPGFEPREVAAAARCSINLATIAPLKGLSNEKFS
jgi:hypothetical protein